MLPPETSPYDEPILQAAGGIGREHLRPAVSGGGTGAPLVASLSRQNVLALPEIAPSGSSGLMVRRRWRDIRSVEVTGSARGMPGGLPTAHHLRKVACRLNRRRSDGHESQLTSAPGVVIPRWDNVPQSADLVGPLAPGRHSGLLLTSDSPSAKDHPRLSLPQATLKATYYQRPSPPRSSGDEH